MMYCNSCGIAIDDGTQVCPNCGTPVQNQYSQQQMYQEHMNQQGSYGGGPGQGQGYYQNPYAQPQVSFEQQAASLPEELQPISMWGYVGYMVLFSIPLVGLICMIVFAVSGRKLALKNFARAYLVLLAIGIVISIVAGAWMVSVLSNLVGSYRYY